MPFTSKDKGDTAVHNFAWVFPISESREVVKEDFIISSKARLFFEIHKDLKRAKKEGNAQGSEESFLVQCRFENLKAEAQHIKVQTFEPGKVTLFSTEVLQPSSHFVRCSHSFTLPTNVSSGRLQVAVFMWSSTSKVPKKVESSDWFSENADFTFVVDGADFKVHKAVFIARSAEFRNVFNGSVNKTALINDISKDDFKEFLRFIYTSSSEFTNVRKMLFIARKFDVNQLGKACAGRLRADLSDATAEEAFFAAHEFGCDDELKGAAFKLVQARFAKINCKMPDSFVGKPKAVKDAIEKKKALDESKKTLEEALNAEDV